MADEPQHRQDEQLRRDSGEELIDEEGRNPTQQRMDSEGTESRPVDVEQGGIDAGGPAADPERPPSRSVDTDDAMMPRQGDVGIEPRTTADDELA